MRSKILRAGLFSIVCSSASAQSLNIDYGDGFGTPPAAYPAAGLPGHWNTLTGEPGIAESLVDLDGKPVVATVIRPAGVIEAVNDGKTGGSDEQLMDEGVVNVNDVVKWFRFADLESGRYQVIVYAWPPDQRAVITGVVVNRRFTLLHDCWNGFLEGSTHVVDEIVVVDGTLAVGFWGFFGGGSSFLNGIQLYKIIPGDADRDGSVGVKDLLIVLASWGPCPDCAADFNDDGVVDFADLIIVLANWT